MKIYTNLYKKLLLLFFTFCTLHNVQTEDNEFHEDPATEEIEEIKSDHSLKRTYKAINTNDLANFHAMLAKQTVHQITGGSLENNLTSISNTINNLSIVAQIGLIYTSSASSALTTTLIVLRHNVDDYNNAIKLALTAITEAVITPSKNNTITALNLLNTARDSFNNIIVDYSSKSVSSMYSLAEINNALAQLNTQLEYLCILQR